MRVLNVHSNMDPVWGGGTAERTRQTCLALAALPQAEATLLTLDLGLTPEWRREMTGVEVVAVPCANRRFQLPWAAPSRMRQLIERVDVIHLLGHWTLLNALVARQARILGKPYVVCPAGALSIVGRSRRLKRLYNRCFGNRLLRRAARHILISTNELPHLDQYGIDRGRAVLIPNGVRPEDFRFRDDVWLRRRFGLGERPFVLFVGRLNSIKGPDLIVEAFARLGESFPQHELVLAGPDEGMAVQLRELARRLGIGDSVRFLGFVAGEEKSALYHAAELLAIPSRQEAMSIVVLEGGACGTPVVFTDQCGLEELSDLGAGVVVPATTAGLERGLRAMLGDPGGSRAMGERLRALVLERYSWDAIVARFVAVLREVLAEGRTPRAAGDLRGG